MILGTGNEDLDRRLGGVPFPSLIMMEGDHGTGKSVMAAQFAMGFVSAGKSGHVITTEHLTMDYLRKMREVKLDLVKPFLKGKLKIVPINTGRFTWNSSITRKVLRLLVDYVASVKTDFVVVDSFTVLATFVEERELMDFLRRCRLFVGEGKLMLLTVHPKVFKEDLLSRLKSEVDVYFTLSSTTIGGRRVKVLEKVKTVGGLAGVDALSFDVDPSLGIKIVPLSLSRA